MKKAVEHIDPIRHPNVFEPIEKEVLEIHSVGVKKLLVDVTKILVRQTKEKQ